MNAETKCVESNDPTEIMFIVFVSYIKPIMNGVDDPFIIYQSTIPHLSVDTFVCDNTCMSMSSFCILVLNSIIKANKNQKSIY
jgi:hypothetical protein